MRDPVYLFYFREIKLDPGSIFIRPALQAEMKMFRDDARKELTPAPTACI